ncbi:MAG TPA: rod shape-determining protein [Thermoanaerobaculia bacterium]
MATLLRRLQGPDLAVDLGSATTRVASASSRRTLKAPSMVGRTRALRGGVVVEPDCAVEVLRPLFARIRRFGLARPRVVATVPTDADRDERRTVEEVVRRAGAAAVALAPEPLAAAIGAELDLSLPYAQLIVDIGYGVTDCVVVRSGGIIESSARRVGCGDLEEALVRYVADRHGAVISAAAAREAMLGLWLDPEPRWSGRKKLVCERGGARGGEVMVELANLAEALAPARERILGVVERLTREVPDGIGAELVESGLHLTGGGALLPGLPAALARRTGLRVRRFPDPLGAVIQGGRRLIESVTRQGAWS